MHDNKTEPPVGLLSFPHYVNEKSHTKKSGAPTVNRRHDPGLIRAGVLSAASNDTAADENDYSFTSVAGLKSEALTVPVLPPRVMRIRSPVAVGCAAFPPD